MSIKTLVENLVWSEQSKEWIDIISKTHAAAVNTEDGSNVQDKLEQLHLQIEASVAQLKGGVDEGGDTLAKLYAKISTIKTALDSDDATLDSLQEVVDYIKANKGLLELLGGSKIDVADISNDLATIIEGKVLDARQGKTLKDMLDFAQGSIASLQEQTAEFATKGELNACL